MAVTIKPEIGRTLYFYPAANNPLPGSPGPLAAKIVYVHSGTCVNLVVWDSNGDSRAFASVNLKQPGCDVRPGEQYAAWMPFQVDAAEKNQPKATSPQNAAEQGAKRAGAIDPKDLGNCGPNGPFASTLPGPGKDKGPATIATLPTATEEKPAKGNTAEECAKQPGWLKK